MEERPNNEQGPELDERAQKAQDHLDRKMRLVKEPNSIVIAPKVRDVHYLAKLLYTTDKAINNMRLNAGVRVSLTKLSDMSAKINEFMATATNYLKAISHGGGYFSPGLSFPSIEQKQLLAQWKNTYVIVPKTAEGESLANLFISLDSAFCEFKVKTPLTDMTRIGEAITHMRDIVRQFRDLTSELAALTRTPFTPPRGLTFFLDEGVEPANGNGRSRARRAKHAKSNMRPAEGAEANSNVIPMEGAEANGNVKPVEGEVSN